MARLLAILTLILSIVLFPPAVLALISNNAVPGDAAYPIKRGLEEVILKIASVHPTTKTWFSIERSGRRFEEAVVLLAAGKEGADNSLDELILQTEAVSREIAKVQDPVKKQELKVKLSAEIKKYDEGLEKVKQEIAVSTPVPAATATSRATATPRVSSRPSATPRATSTPTPIQSGPTPTPVPTPSPEPTPVSTPAPPVYPTPVHPSDCNAVQEIVEKAQCRLRITGEGLSALSNPNLDSLPEPSPERIRKQERDQNNNSNEGSRDDNRNPEKERERKNNENKGRDKDR